MEEDNNRHLVRAGPNIDLLVKVEFQKVKQHFFNGNQYTYHYRENFSAIYRQNIHIE